MDDKDIEYAVKIYQKKSKISDYCYEEFCRDISEHIRRRPMPLGCYDSFILGAQMSKLWKVLNMSVFDIVKYSKLNMAKFSRRFCIPYRTLQTWCNGTNPCPIYVKLMLAKIINVV